MRNQPNFIPYVYEIVHKPTLQKYIGVRYGKRICGKLPEEDLGVTYFSSSSNPILSRKNQEENPELFQYNIIACFPNDTEAAREYEEELHLHYRIGEDDTFLNSAVANRYTGFTRESSLKGAKTRTSTLTEEGITIANCIGIRSAKTRLAKNEQGISIQDITNQKLSQKFKGKRSGENNPNSKTYRIYREDGSLYCEIPLSENIKDYLKKHDLPFSFYYSQIKGGKPILNEQMSCHMSVHSHLTLFKGWYCVSVNKDGSENCFYDKKEVLRYIMVDKNSNIVEVFGRNKTLKAEALKRGWPMNSVYKSYKNNGQPLFYDSRPEDLKKQENKGLKWLRDCCFIKADSNGEFYHDWVEKDKKIDIGE